MTEQHTLRALERRRREQGAGEPRYRLQIVRRIAGLMARIEGLRYLPPIGELAAEFEVSERTIRRDLNAFEQCGIRVPQWRRESAA